MGGGGFGSGLVCLVLLCSLVVVLVGAFVCVCMGGVVVWGFLPCLSRRYRGGLGVVNELLLGGLLGFVLGFVWCGVCFFYGAF